MEINKIYLGDNLATLKTFPDKSINCCITSPPYYGLRDYGTGKWVGGDPNCPHKRMSKQSDKTQTGHNQPELVGNVGDAIYKTVCPLCGAVREDMQVGLEETPEAYIARLVEIFREVRRILTDDGTLWVNIGDTYNSTGYGTNRAEYAMSDKQKSNNGSYDNGIVRGTDKSCKPKDLIGIPWMLAFALRNDGWYLRQDIIWHKPNPMPESVKDRCTKSHEYVFLLTKSAKYYFDSNAIQEPIVEVDSHSFHRYNLELGNSQRNIKFGGNKYGDNADSKYAIYSGNTYNYTGMRNKRDVWTVTPSSFKGAHFATFPEELVFPMVMAGCPKDGIVLDPFMGSGTVGVVAKKNYRNYVGCELNPEYVEMANNRLNNTMERLI